MYIWRKVFLPLETFHILLNYHHRIHPALLGFYVHDEIQKKIFLAQHIVKCCVVEN